MAAAPKLPASIKVGYRDIAVRLVDTDPETEDRGTFHSALAELTICGRLLPADQVETAIHEILHACWPSWSMPGDVEECAVSAIAPALAGIWRDNPALIAWISHNLA